MPQGVGHSTVLPSTTPAFDPEETFTATTIGFRYSALAAGDTAIHQGPQRCVHLPLGARAIERQVYDSSNSPYRPEAEIGATELAAGKRPFEPTFARTSADLHIAAVGESGLQLPQWLRACQ